ncbi:leucine-rich repeat domain-containing protein [Pedobacter rhodius]|uniref:EF-hand domain-containing protein n=1 Tax=Pedobacter rhodius TaxID=3004098 RepID=A0ABT4KWQ2_9SPHI|nr:hypothetical protein [Pedobacter sp. SJ11]MCZ4223339.1 hypothetical protein [Pedobacter sp. SJ11]
MFIRLFSCSAAMLFSLSFSFAQTIKFPDPNFKRALIQKKVDANNDGEIDVSEAKKITKLYLEDTPFSSMEGIKQFSNLEEFGTYKNQVSSVDLQGMLSLKRLYLIGGGMETVNLKGCINLEHLSLIGNNLKTIDLSPFKKLTKLHLAYNQFSSLIIGNQPGLQEVDVSNNNIADFRISMCPRLSSLIISKNKIGQNLDLSKFPELKYFAADYNKLSSVNILGLSKLESFSCLYCNIKTLNLSGAEKLVNLNW